MEYGVEAAADLVDQPGLADVALHEPVSGPVAESDRRPAGGQVVHADHLDAVVEQPRAQVRAQKAGATGDQHPGQ